jgi:hypothetical protein
MGSFSLAVAVGCLDALRWLLWGTALLLMLLIVVQFLRQDEDAVPAANAMLSAGLAIAGGASGWMARRLRARAERG